MTAPGQPGHPGHDDAGRDDAGRDGAGHDDARHDGAGHEGAGPDQAPRTPGGRESEPSPRAGGAAGTGPHGAGEAAPDPFAPPPAPGPWPGTGAFTAPPARPAPRERLAATWRASRGDVVAALVVVGVCLLAGLAVALVWANVAPRVQLVATEDGDIYAVSPESETAIGQDGWFAVCGVVAGLVLAVPAYRWLRRYGVGAAVGLALGGLAGGWVAFRFGVDVLGPDPMLEQARRVGAGVRFDQPLDLRAKGVLYLWPLASLIVYLALAAGFPYEGGRPGQAWRPPYVPTR